MCLLLSRKNINCTINESVERFREVCEAAAEKNIPVRACVSTFSLTLVHHSIHYLCVCRYVSCVLGCPYEGPVSPKAVADVSQIHSLVPKLPPTSSVTYLLFHTHMWRVWGHFSFTRSMCM